MNTNEQILFIKSPICNLLNKIVNAVQILGDGMEFYAVNEYLLQSMFLQITGAQEQKMKCICWELATNNIEYRYECFYKKWDYNECSTIVDKTKVIRDLIKEILKLESGYVVFTSVSKQDFINNIAKKFRDLFEQTNVSIINIRKYENAVIFIENLNPSNIVLSSSNFALFNTTAANGSNPFLNVNALSVASDYLYRHRNRCAHNTKSYQLNLPHLDNLRDTTYQGFDNIFIFFIVLIIIDEITIKLFEKYESLLKKH